MPADDEVDVVGQHGRRDDVAALFRRELESSHDGHGLNASDLHRRMG